ncbi:EamA family transporter [Candidatus Woesearchaeota archaeon]|nr:EamA family transporter [Candidatus Woesearchaeota archaeon]
MKMENWVIYGLIASFCFGIQTIIYKYAYQKSSSTPYYAAFVFALGIVLTYAAFLLFKPNVQFEWKSSSLLFVSGIIWAVGFIAVAVAIAQKADVARLAPIYNTNTLIAVVLGIIFLKEIPDVSQMWRVISGAVMIVIGAVLVSV